MPELNGASSEKETNGEYKVNSLVELADSLHKRKAKLTFGNINSIKQFIKFPIEAISESSN